MRTKKFIMSAIVILMIAMVGITVPERQANAQTQSYKLYLPIVFKPLECTMVVTTGSIPNAKLFDITCPGLPDGWTRMDFDTLGHDSAFTDVMMTEGIGHTTHNYPWPYTSFNARLTANVSGVNYMFDIPVNVVWP